ncbi:hypothetical protein ASG73_08780 [Janibacter sp. Soil728]|uniref:BTAD domain-containing putative transcriptional regulator n=1 Tax=Janibacter sp. Soil728 TaxID=1736393 RepID=UPI0006FDEEB1|nr:BTAD domain-containing putative transcriptional regulator [Janibacter sp. Soil728]KRE37730.1 hypothetical protein ASG73_08780 [Janibacter sp. Soil728]
MTPAPQQSSGRVLLRGFVALVGILLIVVGLPAALVVLGGNPLPAEIPSLSEVGDALTRPDDGTLLIAIITVVGWLVWASLALSFLVEIPAAIRGVPAPRLPGLSWQQGRAAAMTGAVVAMLAIGAVGGATPANALTQDMGTGSATPATALAQDMGSSPSAGGDSAGPSASGAAEGHVVTVRTGDTLWDIADRELGDGQRYPELLASSAGLPQPDGGVLSSADDIRLGWLVMIPTATHTPVVPVALSPAAVQLDEMMSNDGGAAPSAADVVAPAPAPAPVAPAAGWAAGSVAAAPDAPVHEVTETDRQGPAATTGLGLVAGAGLLAFVEARRRRQRRGRRPGWRLVLPSDAATRTEWWLRGASDVPGHADLDAALSDLAARCTPAALPSLRAARLGDAEIEVYVVEEHLELPAPWISAGGGTWVLDRRQVPARDRVLRTQWPALVTIGEDEAGARIFVNLEEVGALELHGRAQETEAVLTALAVDLATSEHVRHRVTVVGALPDLVEAVDDPLVTHSPDVADVLARLERQVGDGGLDTEILLIASTLGRDEIQRLRALLAGSRGGALSVVSTSRGLADWSMVVEARHEGLSAVLAPVGMSLRPAAVTRPGYDELLELLRSTSQPTVPGPAWTAGSDHDPLTIATVPRRRFPPGTGADRASGPTSQTDEAAQVRVLGPLQVTGPGQLPADEPLAAELATLLSLHPGSDATGLAAALGLPPLAVPVALQHVDRWLGSGGAPGVGEVDGRYSLTGPLVDWQQLRSLVGPAVATADSASVRAALMLVRGSPLDGVPRHRYGWAASDRAEICAAVADIAHELAQRSLREGDPDGATWAARKGLLAEPVSETLWRDALHASWQSEQVEQARDTAESARRTLGHLGSLETDTTIVVDRLATTGSAEDAQTLRPRA